MSSMGPGPLDQAPATSGLSERRYDFPSGISLEIVEPNQTVKYQYIVGDISTPSTQINLLFAALKPCCKAGCFEYNKPRFEDHSFLALRGRADFFIAKMM